MSQYHSESRGDFAQTNSKSYVSTKAFNGEFQSYSTSMNAQFQTVGSLATVAGANSTTCPAGRVLHFTGKRLVPNVNPGVTSVLYSVYDPISFLNGYINPTSSTFAKFDQNLPNTFNDGRSGSGVLPPLGGQGGKLTVASAGLLIVSAYSSNTVSLNAGNASVGAVSIASTIGGNAANTIVVSTSAATANSTVLLTRTTGMNTITDMYVSAVATGSFTVTVVTSGNTTGGTMFNWLVIN